MSENISREISTKDLYWNLLETKVFEKNIAEKFNLLRSFGIEPIIFKGWAIARQYPIDQPRHSIDIDLSVEPKLYQKARRLLKRERPPFCDLHRGFRHLDTLDWRDLYRNSQTFEIEKTKIRLLRPEDHLRVLCVHWLTDGGEYKHRLWDIFYLVQNNRRQFDWDRCLDTVSARRRRWIICVIGLAHKYLGLDLSDTPFESEAKKLPAWFTKKIEREWNSGVRLVPLKGLRSDYQKLFRQIKKRIPPNPITATINCEGDLDARTRIFYQLRDLYKRAKPSAYCEF